MSEQVTSRLSGFHKLSLAERRAKLAKMFRLSQEELARLDSELQLSPELANTMVENAVGTFSLPLGLGLNLAVNGRDYVVPMVVEEPS
ncbi:MAG: 3-hydroxy-3-methylglutaryl-CoA reductase, partial [Myxococcaceae bacterium]|nr:3-hydroxy-3-methylglutaryl-CoA reductase [Myxococcaceae bacterium]